MKKKSKVLPVSEVADALRTDFFPFKMPHSVVCVPCSRDELFDFTDKHFKEVFGDGFNSTVEIKKNSGLWHGFQSTLKEYRKIHTEYFLFKRNGKVVGWSYGEMEDFETFYMRNTGILPDHQNKKIYLHFLDQFLKYSKKIGYQRVSSQHSVSNAKIISLKMGIGFIVVGTENHDRWGALVKLVKFLDVKREKSFKKTF
jgi:hypothetical protein